MKYKSILITGGTGFFGKHFVNEILNNHKFPKNSYLFKR